MATLPKTVQTLLAVHVVGRKGEKSRTAKFHLTTSIVITVMASTLQHIKVVPYTCTSINSRKQQHVERPKLLVPKNVLLSQHGNPAHTVQSVATPDFGKIINTVVELLFITFEICTCTTFPERTQSSLLADICFHSGCFSLCAKKILRESCFTQVKGRLKSRFYFIY